MAMDPQHRLLLETSWEALENAGIDPRLVRGSKTGVFAGVMYHDYASVVENSVEQVEGFMGTGGSIASGRVSYTFGFEGPAVTVDTACSSSLVALHLAAQALRQGECSLALAGGVTVMATPDTFVDFSRQRGLSADGRCKAFSSTADGTGWGEGVGMLLVERLSDAQRLGHPILAVVRGSAINQDGASNGLTAPNGPSQQRVIRQALANAGVAASEVDVVEAHGTGTVLGDPIEAQALLATYGQERAEPLWLGSIKSNIGHTQAAAGVAGVIKMVQAMRHGSLPRTLHVDEPTPHVDWTEGNVELLTEPRAWETDGRPRRAGVSSFGISGTNAHVILEQAPDGPAVQTAVATGVVPWVLSGKSPEAVRAQAVKLKALLTDDVSVSAVDVAHSLLTSRSAFAHRAAVVGSSRDELLAGLDSVDVVGGSGRVGVVFTGQGAQWAGMAAGLYGRFPVFTETVDEICGLMGLDPTVVTDSTAVVDPTGTAQRVLFMVEVALWRQLQAWGLQAEAVAGHSVGEIAAAHVAGVLSLENACALVSARARLMQALPEGGAMVSVAASEDTVTPLLVDGVSIAAVNGPASVVLSGLEAAVNQVAGALTEQGVKTRELRVSHAFHSALMEPMLADFAHAISGIEFGTPSLNGVSTVTGAAITGEWRDPGYWVNQVREPVRFADAITTLATSASTVLEIGPDAVLSAMGPDNVSDDVVFIPTLRRGRDTEVELVRALARLHTYGVAVDWAAFFAPYGPVRVDLPTYAFQRQRFWPSVMPSRGDASGLGMGAVEHPLLGAVMASAESDRVVLSGRVSLREQSWLGDHVVAGVVLLPGTAFVEMAVRAGDEVGCDLVEELTLQAPLALSDSGAVHLQVIVGEPDPTGRRGVDVYSRPEDSVQQEWTHHATGALTSGSADAGAGLTEWPPAGAVPVSLDGFYEGLAADGLAYGPVFQGVQAAWRRGDDLFAEVALDDSVSAGARAFGIHPALFDAALHTLILRAGEADDAGPALPFSWNGVALKASGASRLRVHARADGALLLADSTGAELATVDTLVTRVIDTESLHTPVGTESVFTVEWTPVPTVVAGSEVAATLLRATGVPGSADMAESVHARTLWMLDVLQEWLRSGEGVLVVTTSGSVAALDGDRVVDLAGSSVWGLVRSAQSENPDRFVLLDTDIPDVDIDLAEIVATGEPQLVLRDGVLHAARLTPRAATDITTLPGDRQGWRLDVVDQGSLEGVGVVGQAVDDLLWGQVRISVRAAGVNFRDALNVLGMYPGDAGRMGYEGAGVVLEVGPGVTGLAVGDRVMGLLEGAFAPEAVVDARMLVGVPRGWSFAEAAATPLVFLTAYYALVDLAGLAAGESVLIHAAAGGVGMAATQIAGFLGAEVFATASQAKQYVLRDAGIAPERVASSRDLAFEQQFLAATGGRGVDVVLDSLAREFVDASLRLLPGGGRFIEMGKTDIREPGQVAAAHPGVRYRSFDLIEAGPDRIQEMLGALRDLFESGALRPLPLTVWDMAQVSQALRYVSQARHVGKVVLTRGQSIDPQGTVLITGASGTLGGLVARHMVIEHHARHLLLVSRRGGDAPGADELRSELAGLGASVTVVACDVADRGQLVGALGMVDPAHPLTAVIHTAGVVADGVLESLTPDQVEKVLRPKVDGAWNLHELTAQDDLAQFVLFSSAAGMFGNAGQANYAAANTFLDTLAAHRTAQGLPGTSMAWGLWQSGMGDALDEGDVRRLARTGRAITDEEGMALFDLGMASPDAELALIHLDPSVLRDQGGVPALLRGLVRTPQRRIAQAGTDEVTLPQRLAGLDEQGQQQLLMDLVLAEVAGVLGYAASATVDPSSLFKELGFDSLTAVELRNRVAAVAGVRLPATLVFDYPTPIALVTHLRSELGVAVAPVAPDAVVTAGFSDEPIAIVGMACRFPGGVNTPDDLWNLLVSGTDAMSGFPSDRGWDLENLYDPEASRPGTSYTRHGGFLHDAAHFDPDFFGISPREAIAMDPQQRLLLETAWESIEHAGIDPTTLRGSDTGVFAGMIYHDYGTRLNDVPEEVEGYLGTGTSGGVASGRVSYTFGFEGPAVTVDTACSSSLVALHWAVQSLRSGECSLALAGGVTVMAAPDTFIEFSRQRGLAADGRCKAFAGAADGTGWGEGVGMLLVERLSDAQRLGHRVLAVVRGSAINQDGASNGLTAPNGPSQQRVIRQALANAGVSASEVDVVEAHGTGTTLGDPIEAQALLATYGRDRTEPLWLGSIKSNIGHTQAAAGVAGVIKMVQAMRHGVLPQTLHVDEPTPHVDWAEGNIELLTGARVWESGRPRRAGVSSFGFSGTNAHVILEQAPEVSSAAVAEPVVAGVVPWVLSGKSPEAVLSQALRLRSFVEDRPELSVVDVAYSLATSRVAMDQRAAVVGPTREELLFGLASMDVVGGSGRVGVVFTGQGAQWAGMAAGLYGRFAVFTEAVDEICALMGLEPSVVTDPDAVVDPTGVAQRVLFMVEVALWRQLQAWGLKVEVVAGHSVGEIAAAHVAGVLSLEDACVLVSARARLMQALPEGGAMVAVAAGEDTVTPLLVEGVSIAAINGPASVVLSGIESVVDRVASALADQGVKTRRLRVSHAFHSALMEPMLADFADAISGIEFGIPCLAGVSTVTGAVVTDEWSDPGYWVRQVREPVRFADAVKALDTGVVLEIGPDAVLSAMGPDSVSDDVVCMPTLRRNRDTEIDLVQALARLHTHGVTVDWEAFFAPFHPMLVELPTYAFQRQHYWLEAAAPVAAGDGVDSGLWEVLENGDGESLSDMLGVDSAALDVVLPALSQWRQRRKETSVVDRLAYHSVWRPANMLTSSTVLAGDWLVLHTGGGVTWAEQVGATAVTVTADRQATAEAISSAVGERTITGVVSFLPNAPLSVLAVQALMDAGVRAPMWMVTTGAVSVDAGERIENLTQAEVWGVGRTVALEHPNHWGGLIDLPVGASERVWSLLTTVLVAGSECEVALRDSGVYTRRLVPASAKANELEWSCSGTVVVTGVLDDALRDWLSDRGAEHFVVIEDPCDRDAIVAALTTVPAESPVSAVVHAADGVDDGVLQSLTAEQVEAVLQVKARPAWDLHELTRDLDLSAFVVFSSTAATFGSAGQANYAAASAFLDALMQQRRADGLPGTSIAWGPWADTGDDAVRARLRESGMNTLPAEQVLPALGQALDRKEATVTVADVDWSRFVAQFTAANAHKVFNELPDAVEAVRGLTTATRDQLARQLRDADETERGRLLADLVRTSIARVLGHRDGAGISFTRPFTDLGFTSLSAVEFRNQMWVSTGLQLPATLVFDYPTPEALVEMLAGQLLGEARQATEVPVTAAVLDEPVVIVGMACRYPGGVFSPEGLWDLVASGTDAISMFPTDRGWDVENLYDPELSRAGTSYTRHGGFLHEAAEFDAEFFGISPREATAMDPQQRLLLETSWEALERAGIDPASIRGSRTGVFTGVAYHDYGTRLSEVPEEFEGYLGTGSSSSVVSGRVSYTFGFEGPAVTVDTACSSSLVALHLAVQALRQGECSLALAGGVTVMATPHTFVDFSRQRGLSADGRCKAFSAAADGTGWGEGVGMLLVERLSDAQRLGHPILAVVRGSAINQDGASNGLTAPNGPSQQRVIMQALANAGIAPSEVDAVEAHGTGTTLGDPIEAQALLATYGQDRGEPLWLGSLKSNIGHAQAAAGVGGVIKMVQAMRHGVLPRTLHVDEPTPHVDWASGAVRLLTEQRAWDTDGRPRRAGVSSFGFSGTNAHVIIEQPPVTAAVETQVSAVVPWVLSGKSPEAVLSQALRLRSFVEDRPELSAVDVAYSLATSRVAMDQRAAVVGPTCEDLLAGLTTVDVVGGSGRVGVVFTGQGAQWAGMAAGLYGRFEVFTEAVDEICALMGLEPSVVTDPDAVVDPTGIAQRVLFMVEVALWRQLQAWGLKAEVVAGHSVGEIAAAHVAGVLSLEGACSLVSARAKLMQALPEGGVMVAVAASEDTVAPLLVEGVSIAAVNGPASVVLSGLESAVDQVVAVLDVKTRRLRVSHAFHSALMEPMLGEFAEAISGIEWGTPSLRGVSTVTGAAVTSEWGDPGYWVRQVREPVRFADAVANLGVNTVLEIGPDAVLSAMGPDNVAFIPTLRRGRDTETELVQALARLHTHGVTVDWVAFFAPYKPNRVDLPTYAFQRQHYWLDGTGSVAAGDGVDSRLWDVLENGDGTSLSDVLGVDSAALDVVLPALTQWRQRRKETSVVDGWAYHAVWRRTTSSSATLTGDWLVLHTGDGAEWAEQVGATTVTVTTDRRTTAEAITTAVQQRTITGVVSFLPDAVLSVVAVQALVDAGIRAPLWMVTAGAVSVDADDRVENLTQAEVWGVGRSVAIEYPNQWGGLIDLPANPTARALAALTSAVADTTEGEVAIRTAGTYVRRLVPAPADGGAEFSLSGTVLVTGGTGALAGYLGDWLVERGTEHVLLASRRGQDAPGVGELVARLAKTGMLVSVAACDVSDRDSVAALLAGIPAEYPLTGVVHAAGVLDDGVLDSLTPERVAAVLRAKSVAAWHLHELTKDHGLSAFVMYSSIAATFGSAGQANYAAANAFLDALAEQRRADGLAATTISWGPWTDGMAARGDVQSRLRAGGMNTLDPAKAMSALGRALGRGDVTVTVADIDWARFLPTMGAVGDNGLYDELPQVKALNATTAQSVAAEPDLIARLGSASAAERERLLLDLVRTHAAATLGHDGPETVGPDRAFSELGFDSLGAVEFRNRMDKACGVELPTTMIFDYPTPKALVAYLHDELFGPDEPVGGGSVLAELDRLETAMSAVDSAVVDPDQVAARLRSMLTVWTERHREQGDSDIESASADDILDILKQEFGKD
ncbi:hypothetical protein ALI144C_17235 [Actinosynnema sp. ALI-1.44]|nr:hypothetical protein ALI144C_17235 [Actinosynnema sp. ALI-1.44]